MEAAKESRNGDAAAVSALYIRSACSHNREPSRVPMNGIPSSMPTAAGAQACAARIAAPVYPVSAAMQAAVPHDAAARR